MKPNNNIQNNNTSEPRPVRAPGFANGEDGVSAGGASAGMQNDGGSGVAFEDKPKKSHGMLYGMILLAILAVGGIGFGVWAMMDGNSQMAKKDEQIADLRGQLAEKSEVVVEDNTTVVDDDEGSDSTTSTSVVNTEDYIYVGEWGLKIRIPDNLTITGYVYSMLPGYTSVKITGNTKGGQYLPGFADMSVQSPWLGIISRYPKGTEMSPMSPPAFVFSDEQYDYYCSNPQMVISTDESEIQWEVESVNVIQQMLKNKDNYSKI